MGATPYPLPRNTRETAILTGDGVNLTFGPFTLGGQALKIFGEEDVEVWTKPAGAAFFALATVTITKSVGFDFDTFTVTFAAAPAVSTQFVVSVKRLHEREVAVTKGGVIDSDALEQELSKQGTVIEELRRDVGRAARSDFGEAGLLFTTIAEGHFYKRGPVPGNTMIDGGDGDDIINAQAYAAATLADRLLAQAARLLAEAAALSSMSTSGLMTFATVNALLTNPILSYTVGGGLLQVFPGALVTAEDFSYIVAAEAATDYHVITARGVKLYGNWASDGWVKCRAFGTWSNGIAHPLSTRYSLLTEAQAAFPRCNTAGLIVNLTDDLDWACIQEANKSAEGPSNRLNVLIGSGTSMINRTLRVGGLGKGCEIAGTVGAVAQQGSGRAGCTLRYTGALAEELMAIVGTFTKPTNMNLENATTATHAISFTGADVNSGAGRSHMTHVSVQTATGMLNFTISPFKIYNGIDYTYWTNIECVHNSPYFLYYDGGGAGFGGTTRFHILDSVFSAIGDTPKTYIYVKDANVEQMSFVRCSFNNYSTTQPITIFDCMDIDGANPLFGIDSLTFSNVEVDGLSVSTASRFAKLKNVRHAFFDMGMTQNVSATQTALVDLTNSTGEAHGYTSYAVNGPFFKCMDALSRVIPSRSHFVGVRGLADASLQGNIIQLAQSGAVELSGADVDPRDQLYVLTITANTGVTIATRDHAATPPGRWLQGQTVTLHVKNTAAVTVTGIVFNAQFKAAAFGTIVAGFGRVFRFYWNGTNMVEIARSGDIPN